MARKSRKTFNQEAPEEKKNVPEGLPLLPTAAYIRLSSVDDEDNSSIESQTMLVQNYINQQPELQLKDTYIDNGYTGTNFDRPEFDRMMQDVRSGRIQCIVVKDLSRFGRDYLEMGYYLETIFPRLNVRFIAVTDNFDNSSPDDMASITVPIKNIVNNYYAKDISRKLISSNEARRNRGDLINGTSPYGYFIDKEKQAYVIDEGTAGYVRIIYQWYLMGVSTYEIAKRLEFIQAPHPCDTKKTDQSKKEQKKDTKWRIATIKRILTNPAYAGDLAGGKTKRAFYKGQKIIRTKPEEWVIKKNAHPAIVLRSDFNAVQNLLHGNGKECEDKCPGKKNECPSENPFLGIIYCGCCGSHMAYVKPSEETHSQGYYFCPTLRGVSHCGHHDIKEDLLKIMVMDQIHVLIQTACDMKELAESLLDAAKENPSLRSLKKKISALSGQIDQAEKRKTALYEDYAEGVLDKEEYQYMKEHYIREKQEKEEKLEKLQEKIHVLQKKAESCLKFSEHLEQYADTRVFDEKLVHELVESIYVGLDDTLDITFKCKDVYQDLADAMEDLNHEE